MQYWIDGELWYVTFNAKIEHGLEHVTASFVPLDPSTRQVNYGYFAPLQPGTRLELGGIVVNGKPLEPRAVVRGEIKSAGLTNTPWQEEYRIPVVINTDGFTCQAAATIKHSASDCKGPSLATVLSGNAFQGSEWHKTPEGGHMKGAPLLIGGQAQKSIGIINGAEFAGQEIQFGNSIGSVGYHFWARVSSSLFICDRPLLNNISWDDLAQQGLVFGKPVLIDGVLFKARLITAGRKARGAGNEWSMYMRGTRRIAWNVQGVSSWTQSRGRAGSVRVVSLNGAQEIPPDIRDESIGWRPALEMIG